MLSFSLLTSSIFLLLLVLPVLQFSCTFVSTSLPQFFCQYIVCCAAFLTWPIRIRILDGLKYGYAAYAEHSSQSDSRLVQLSTTTGYHLHPLAPWYNHLRGTAITVAEQNNFFCFLVWRLILKKRSFYSAMVISSMVYRRSR